MKTKLFEIRDAATFIPAMGTLMDARGGGLSDVETWLLRRAGFDFNRLVWLSKINSHPETATYSPHDWRGNRTMMVAHHYIELNWDSLESGALIDVEFILKVRAEAKTSERIEHGE